MQWLQQHPDAAGILTPDVDGVRMLYDIANKTYHPLQVDADHPENDVVPIGKFRFSKTGFHLAQQILLRSAQSNAPWVVVDEVGLLEIKHSKGLEPIVSDILYLYKAQKNLQRFLLLVIRDSLLEEAKVHYNLENTTVLDKAFFK